MNMQHRRSQFGSSGIIEIRGYCDFKQDKAIRDRRIFIDNLSMASRATTERIADDYPDIRAGWYCLRVLTGSESSVEKRFEEAGVEVLVVRCQPYKIVRRGRIRSIPSRPVIAGYVLVRCMPVPAAIAGLLGVDGVLGIVGDPVRPFRADEKEVMRFKLFANEGKYEHHEAVKTKFAPGEYVLVSEGPFASFPATVQTVDEGKFRVSVEVMIFGRETPVELDIAQIEKM